MAQFALGPRLDLPPSQPAPEPPVILVDTGILVVHPQILSHDSYILASIHS